MMQSSVTQPRLHDLTHTAGMRLPFVLSVFQAGQQQPADGSQAPGMKDFWLTRSNDALESFYLVNRCAHKPCVSTGQGNLMGQGEAATDAVIRHSQLQLLC